MRAFMSLTKALADPNRVRLLLALRGRELCACQITELFRLAPSTMSKHLSILHQAGLVDSRKSGRWVHYSLPGQAAPVAVRQAIEWVANALSENEQVRADGRRLKALLQVNPSDLCRRQCQK